MAKQVRLTLPDDLYKELEEQAREGNAHRGKLYYIFISKTQGLIRSYIFPTGYSHTSTTEYITYSYYTKPREPRPGHTE